MFSLASSSLTRRKLATSKNKSTDISRLSKLSAKVDKDRENLDATTSELKASLIDIRAKKHSNFEQEFCTIFTATSFFFKSCSDVFNKSLITTKVSGADEIESKLELSMILAKKGELPKRVSVSKIEVIDRAPPSLHNPGEDSIDKDNTGESGRYIPEAPPKPTGLAAIPEIPNRVSESTTGGETINMFTPAPPPPKRGAPVGQPPPMLPMRAPPKAREKETSIHASPVETQKRALPPSASSESEPRSVRGPPRPPKRAFPPPRTSVTATHYVEDSSSDDATSTTPSFTFEPRALPPPRTSK